MKIRLILLSVLLLIVSACGYQFEGGGYLNEDITRVAVKIFENKSSETGAETTFTNRLVEEVIKKTDTKVVSENLAEYVIEGQINAITFSTLSRSTTDDVTERRVTAVVDLKIMNKENETVWSVKAFSSNEAYTVSDDVSVDDSNKKEAIDKIALRTAERLVSKMLSNF